MSIWKRLLGLGSEPSPVATDLPSGGPMGLSMGSLISIDPSLKMLFDGSTVVSIPTAQKAFAEGVIDLGQSHWLTRIYLDDEAYWLQALTTGARDGQLESLVLFNFVNSQSVHSAEELASIAGPGSAIGLPSYLHEGHEYRREWGSSDGQTELVDLIERVTNPNESYEVRHRSMLYSRDIGLTDRKELLLFSVEEAEDGGVSVSTSLGVTLFTSDIQST